MADKIKLSLSSAFDGSGFTAAQNAIKTTSRQTKDVSEAMKGLGLEVEGMGGKAGQAAGAVGKLVGALGSGPLGLAIAAITTLVGLFKMWRDHAKQVREEEEKTAKALKERVEKEIKQERDIQRKREDAQAELDRQRSADKNGIISTEKEIEHQRKVEDTRHRREMENIDAELAKLKEKEDALKKIKTTKTVYTGGSSVTGATMMSSTTVVDKDAIKKQKEGLEEVAKARHKIVEQRALENTKHLAEVEKINNTEKKHNAEIADAKKKNEEESKKTTEQSLKEYYQQEEDNVKAYKLVK